MANPVYEQELNRISDLFENTKINYQVLDDSGRLCYVNRPWLTTLGYEKDEILGRPFVDLLNGESKSLFQKKFNECSEDIINNNHELTLRCADNSEIIASFSCFCNKETQDSSHRYHCAFQNITRLKDTERALRASEDNYEHIFNSIRDVYYRADSESRILLVSPSVQKVSGYTPEELIGRSMADFFSSPQERSNFRAQLIGKGCVDDYDLKLRKKDGGWFDASISAQIIKGEELDDFYVEGVIRDISQRKKNESQIASYNARLNDLTDKLPVVLFQLNQKKDSFSCEYISSNVQSLLGITSEEILADIKAITPLFSKQAKDDILHELSLAQKEKRTAKIEFEIQQENGELKWCRLKASLNPDDPDQLIWTGVAIDISKEHSTKQKIKEQEQQLQALYHFASVGITTMSLTGIVTSINPAICELTGYAEDDIVGKHFRNLDVFYKQDLPLYLKLFTDALKGKIPKGGILFKWKHKTGEKRWAEAYLNLIREKGKITGFQGVFLDVTDRVLLEKERNAKQEDSRFLFDSALSFLKIQTEKELFQFLAKQMRKLIPEAIINLNSVNDDQSKLRVESVTGMNNPLRSGILSLVGSSLNGKEFDINRDTFRYAKHGKLIQMNYNLYDLTVKQIPENICKQIEKLIRLREIHEISIGIGDKIMGGCAIFICGDQKLENIPLIENLFRQATEALSRLQTHRKLEQREEQYRSLSENVQNMILRVNTRNEVIYANRAFLKTFNLQSADILHQPLRLYGFPSAFCDLIHQTIRKTKSSQRPQSCDNVLVMGNTPRFYEWRMFPETDRKKGTGSVIMFVYDITKRKEAEAQELNYIENKNKIFRLIGHDLKNPFNSILGFLDLLTDRYDDLSDELKKKYLNYIKDSSTSLHELLQSMQEWSKADEEQDPSRPLFFDIKPLIDTSLEYCKLGIIEKELVVENCVPEGTLINADYNMIAAAIRNLLSNACKFSHKGGMIEIGLRKSKKEAILVIRDQGAGMTDVELKKLLSLETTFTKTGTNGEKGTGIGFKFAREFIERNHGWIRVKSRAGKGTQIFIGLKTK